PAATASDARARSTSRSGPATAAPKSETGSAMSAVLVNGVRRASIRPVVGAPRVRASSMTTIVTPSSTTSPGSPSGRGRRPYTSGDDELDARLRDVVATLDTPDSELVFEILATATRLAGGPISRLDRKIANSALKEM